MLRPWLNWIEVRNAHRYTNQTGFLRILGERICQPEFARGTAQGIAIKYNATCMVTREYNATCMVTREYNATCMAARRYNATCMVARRYNATCMVARRYNATCMAARDEKRHVER